MPPPPAWIDLVRENVLLGRTLDDAGFARLCANAHALAARLIWEGCRGQEITDEVKATIAGQAAILVHGLDGYLFDHLSTVLVYPGSFLATDDDGEEAEMRLGEAMPDGPVVLSWWHSRWAGRRLGQESVVLHEFAHKLAELGDPELGMPPFGKPGDAKKWKKVMGSARRQLEQDDFAGKDTLLDPYGAESMSEFFAVATETFFQKPRDLRKEMPAVYNLLAACYRQDPALRPVPESVEIEAEVAEVEYASHAVAECTAALRKWPGRLDFLTERATWREKLGDLDGALADWAEAARHADDDGGRVEALYAQADILRLMGRDGEADRMEDKADELADEEGW